MKKPMGKMALLFVISGLLLVVSCKVKSPDTFIQPPSDILLLPYQEFIIQPADKTTIQVPGGTTIIIPENAFVDANNKPVTTPVKISYREMKNAFDIMRTGIPMKYDSAGVEYYLTTAGMFDISGKTGDQPVFIAKDKTLTVSMTSKTEGIYNFYRLDTINRNWEFIDRQNTVIDTQNTDTSIKNSKGDANENIKIVRPRKADRNSIIFDFKINYSAFPDLAEFKEVLWEYRTDVNEEKNPDSLKWIYKTNWSDMSIEQSNYGEGLYEMTLKNSKKTFKAIVSPVLTGKDYQKALTTFNDKVKNYKTNARRFQNERNFIRTYGISSFGMYNWDIIYFRPDFTAFKADIKIKGVPEKDLNNVTIFFIADNERVVIPIYRRENKSIVYSPTDKTSLVAFLPGNKVAVFKNNDFVNLNVPNKPDSKTTYTIEMQVLQNEVKKIEDIIQQL